MRSKPLFPSVPAPTVASSPAGRCCEQMLRPFWAAVGAGLLESGASGVPCRGRGCDSTGSRSVKNCVRRQSGGASQDFATIHGDEPQGAGADRTGAAGARRQPDLFRGYELHLYPLCNPTGYEDSTRHSRRGEDLNRHFWRGSSEPEVALLEQEIASRRFHGIIALHADDTSDGVYGFVRGATISQELLAPALDAASARLPVNREPVIDGFRAQGGIIVEGYDGILSAGPSEPRPFEIVFETPAHAAPDLQVQATVLAMEAILRRYRAMLSVANDI